MNEARRERIRELIRGLEAARERVHAIWMEEEGALDDRLPPSKETGSGILSEDAVQYLEEAVTDIQGAIDCMHYAVGDDSLPEPPATAFIRRRL